MVNVNSVNATEEIVANDTNINLDIEHSLETEITDDSCSIDSKDGYIRNRRSFPESIPPEMDGRLVELILEILGSQNGHIL